MIDRAHDLPITKQAEVLRISRGGVYYRPLSVPEADLAIMRRLNRLHLEFPFAGSRMLRGLRAGEGCKIGRRHVKTLMQRMGIEALYRRPRTSKPEPGHKIYPYPLRGMAITRPNQVSAMDRPTFRWRAASSIWPWCSTGSAAACCRGGCRSDGGGVLRRNAGGCVGSLRHAGRLQHRPGLAVRRHGLHLRARQQRHCDQHGRQRRLAGQCLRRAAVAQRQIRGGVSASLRQRQRLPRLAPPLPGLLQQPQTSFEP
jgi:putative transposase